MSQYTASIQQLYVAYFGRPADAGGLAFWEGKVAAANGSTAAISAAFAASAEYTTAYAGKSAVETVNQVYVNLFGHDADPSGLLFWANALQNKLITIDNVVTAIATGAQGTDKVAYDSKVAAATAFTAALDTTAEILGYSTAAIPAAKAFIATVTDEATLETAVAAIDTTVATVVAAGTPATPATTFTLTTGVDSGSAFKGGAGDDTFNGTTGTTTLTALDNLDGGAGTDTLNYIQTATISVPASVKVANIEKVVMSSGADITADASGWTGLTDFTAAGTGGVNVTVAGANVITTDSLAGALDQVVAGGKDVTITAAKVSTGDVTVTGATGVVSISTTIANGGAAGPIAVTGGTSVSVAQAIVAGATATTGTVAITNSGKLTSASAVATKGTDATPTYNTVTVTGQADATDKDDTITSITATGYTTVNTVHTNKLSTLNLGTGSGNITIDNGDALVSGSAVTTLNLGVNGLTGGTLDDDDIYTTIKVNSTGAASTIANITDTALTSLSLTGDKKLTLTSIAGATALTSIDAAAATGGMTISSTLLVGTSYAGGSGVDTITLGATTKAITTGAGDDVVTLAAATTALGTGGSIDAGAGTGDVLSFADADDATTASGGTTFATTVSNFEVVRLAGAAGAGVTVNVANLDNISKVEAAVDLGQTLAVSNIASGGTVTYTAAQTAASTITVASAAANTADVFNVAISSAAARNINGVTISNVETINFLTDDTATTTTGIEHTAALTAAAATKVTVAGDAGLTLTFTGTALTTFDASGVTDGDVTWTAGALAGAATIKGGATNDANVIVLSAALDDITYTGGSGTDTITMNHATNHDGTTNTFTLGNGANTLTATNNDGDNTVTGGTGVDTISVGNGTNNISTGSGNDVITVGTGANTIDAGTGNDTITIGASAGANTVNVGTGTDAIVFTGVQTAAGYYTSLTGMGAGDTIDFSATAHDGGGLAAGVLGSKITLGGASNFANYLNAAAAGDGSTDSAFHWFQFNGNTYIVLDRSAAATFQDGGDQVVELVGLVNLATSTQDGSYVVTLV
ncbi:beta strand repeat-containing protein [Pseudoduganella danionis]|uniref:beta strand repeat-containing protein n=1 Tax=Pseudoduganella danionis TaxID=1890295 RepID=UPI0035B1126F